MNVVHTKNAKNKNIVELLLHDVFTTSLADFLKYSDPKVLYRS